MKSANTAVMSPPVCVTANPSNAPRFRCDDSVFCNGTEGNVNSANRAIRVRGIWRSAMNRLMHASRVQKTFIVQMGCFVMAQRFVPMAPVGLGRRHVTAQPRFVTKRPIRAAVAVKKTLVVTRASRNAQGIVPVWLLATISFRWLTIYLPIWIWPSFFWQKTDLIILLADA